MAVPDLRTAVPGTGRTATGAAATGGAPSSPGTRGSMNTAGPDRTQRTISSTPINAKSAGNKLLPVFSRRDGDGVDMSEETHLPGFFSDTPKRP